MSHLSELRECLLEILKALPERPRRLEMRVGEASIELDWADAGRRDPELGPGAARDAADRTGLPAVPGDSPASAGDASPPTAASALPATGTMVCSPSVGTFYRSPEPGASPFVAEGDLVRPGQQVAIVEAMKLMLPVEATQAGRVARILKVDGAPVEYGEPLMDLAPPSEADAPPNGTAQVHPQGGA